MLATAPALDDASVLTRFRQVLGERALEERQRCLLMIDAARYDKGDVLKALYTYDDNPQWCWLFENTPFDRVRDAGPVVVETALGSPLCHQAVMQWADDGALAIVVTAQGPEVAMTGFRQSLMVQLPTRGPCILRPYDGRFLEVLSVCLPEALEGLVGAGDQLIWPIDYGEATHWSAAQGINTEADGLQRNHGNRLEELLGWIQAWPRCTAIVNDSDNMLHLTTQRIRTLWSAGHACPESDAELARLWSEMELATK